MSPQNTPSAHRHGRPGKQILAVAVLPLALALLVASITGAVVSAQGQSAQRSTRVLGYQISQDRVAVPSDWGAPLTKPLKVQAAYNGEDIRFRMRFPTDKPSIHHNYLVYEGGKWVRHGEESVGSVPDFLYEDRITFHVDDGAVGGFANQGCFVTCHSDLRNPFMYAAPASDEVRANSYYRDVLKQSDTRKYIPESRRRTGEWWDVKWDDISAADADYIQGLKEAGVLLDQWHWRSYRGGPIGWSDDMYVLDYRNADEGRSAFVANFDAQTGQPISMFDPAKTGYAALRFDDVRNLRVPLDSLYYLGPDTMAKYDPNRPWKDGDALPYYYLRRPDGSHADISSKARWTDGWWDVELSRKMDTRNPDDKPFRLSRTYNIAFAFYTYATGNRFHYVTFPVKLGVGVPGKIQAVRYSGEAPDWNSAPTAEITGFYPGQTSWQFVTSDEHPGAPGVRADTVSCSACHTEKGLALRAVGLEMRSRWEAPRPWTWAGGLLGIIGIVTAGVALRRR